VTGTAVGIPPPLVRARDLVGFETRTREPRAVRPKGVGVAKAKGVTMGMVAATLTSETTAFLKAETNRTRPDASADASFPSSHTSNAAVHATLVSRNLSSLGLADRGRTVGQIGVATLTGGTAWAHVEAHQHFPSDGRCSGERHTSSPPLPV
jgi:membrane-associated phospholipid phosphatase